jgi:hypothetical protein
MGSSYLATHNARLLDQENDDSGNENSEQLAVSRGNLQQEKTRWYATPLTTSKILTPASPVGIPKARDGDNSRPNVTIIKPFVERLATNLSARPILGRSSDFWGNSNPAITPDEPRATILNRTSLTCRQSSGALCFHSSQSPSPLVSSHLTFYLISWPGKRVGIPGCLVTTTTSSDSIYLSEVGPTMINLIVVIPVVLIICSTKCLTSSRPRN